jgi:hypothetical protein
VAKYAANAAKYAANARNYAAKRWRQRKRWENDID